MGLYFFRILSMSYHQCLTTFEFVLNTRVKSAENYLFFLVEWGEGKVEKTLILGDFPGSPVIKTLSFHYRGHVFDPWLWN